MTDKRTKYVPKKQEDKFFRDGAWYVCKKCSAKFFTREEASACYEKGGEKADTAEAKKSG